VWSWYRSFPEQLIVAHLLKELCGIMEADGSSLSHKIPIFTASQSLKEIRYIE